MQSTYKEVWRAPIGITTPGYCRYDYLSIGDLNHDQILVLLKNQLVFVIPFLSCDVLNLGGLAVHQIGLRACKIVIQPAGFAGIAAEGKSGVLDVAFKNKDGVEQGIPSLRIELARNRLDGGNDIILQNGNRQSIDPAAKISKQQLLTI